MPADVSQRAEVGPAWADPAERVAAGRVVRCADNFENSVGLDFRRRCEHYYRLYRGFKQFRNVWENAGENDRDGVLYDAKRDWGANLHIPLSFQTVETMVPRAIAQRPRMLYLPRDERWEENVASVRLLIDSQQDQIDIELEYQDVMRAGFLYGLGVGKSFWRREWAMRRRATPWIFGDGKYRLSKPQRTLSFDDPDFENIDVFDFMWDPYGSSIRSCGWVIHRSWLSLDMCLDRVQGGQWNTATAALLDEDKLRALGGSSVKYDEVWNERMAASGFANSGRSGRGEQIHELLEWHDGEQVLSVLDRQVNVQDAENPCYGVKPFQIYRPTKLPNQMVGIGEIEPVEHLNRELDTLRSQRRDAATLALCAGYAYDSAAIDEEDLVFQPNVAVPVRNADVRTALMPLQRQEVPGSAYQDEQVIRQDFMGVTGLSDQDGSGGAIGTATEAQLVQAALSKRIELKSRRFEVEIVRQTARCFLLLNQRMILSQRQPIRQPDSGMTLEDAAAVGRWKWVEIGPGELRGEYEIEPEGGSLAAANVPQRRQDATQILQLFGNNPFINQQRPLLKALELFDIKDPESWLAQSDPPVPQAALKILESMGVKPELIQFAVTKAQHEDPQLEGPNAQEVGAMMSQQQPEEAAA